MLSTCTCICHSLTHTHTHTYIRQQLKGKETEKDVKAGITRGILQLNELLHSCPGIDDTLSGTTAIAIIFLGDVMYICNVGDSRAILGQRVNANAVKKGGGGSGGALSSIQEAGAGAVAGGGAAVSDTHTHRQAENGDGPSSLPNCPSTTTTTNPSPDTPTNTNTPTPTFKAYPLSDDQTPYRADERERVKKCGARVMSMEQIAGHEPMHENWGNVKLGEEVDESGNYIVCMHLCVCVNMLW